MFVVSTVLIVSHLQDEEQPTNEENMHLRHADLVARLERIEQGQASCCWSRRLEKGVLCTAKKKKKGCCVPPKKKGGEEARGHSTVRGAPQNGDGRVEADFAISSVASQNLYFFERGAKNFRKAENAHTQKKRATRSRLVHRDDAEGDWASRCRRRESTSRRQAKKLQPLRKPLSASV